ncbi:gamma-glutamyl-gamma-aminobutyrate hydrolase family protein [Aquimarina sp. RZ0]|uniref:glutamine amidotransferase-related protein n=1 Tax=Aquimarina sp. RZ0 TaxID=2607730 RepID=UPI0011F3FBEC|nr:gamma-glutamyl-gamma-aminobutyrate hydrolase family protein [Aquimarina sp. RZ0]KAA1243473.1 GMP synthase [Aquimarina sp. RZ0]
MINIHFIIHEVFEGPGVLEHWAIASGYRLSFSRVYQHEKLPESLDDIDCLIIMGGPQSPNTTVEECPYFDAKAEMELIDQAINDNKIVIGVCLGAQMIGQALGAPVEKSPYAEIGSFPIRKTKEGNSDQKLLHFPQNAVVGHWHGDMAGLTSEAKVLAYSKGCPRQIIQYSALVYGLQCHLEFNPESIELLIQNSTEELERLRGEKYVQTPEELRNNDYKSMNALLFTFMDNLIKQYVVDQKGIMT